MEQQGAGGRVQGRKANTSQSKLIRKARSFQGHRTASIWEMRDGGSRQFGLSHGSDEMVLSGKGYQGCHLVFTCNINTFNYSRSALSDPYPLVIRTIPSPAFTARRCLQ